MNDKTDKNEPGRFLGEGVSFRAKLIGVLEVPEARGDRMCQEALADLKMAIRAAGEHKQRIQVHVAIDGLRLRDDKTGDSLYHHPVHKISFIAQDMTDSRAFGYIFGSPDTGHRFFGIKTDKAASQVVIAMRDLFQVVFELKKKEVEMAKQQLEGKSTGLTRHLVAEPKIKTIISSGEATIPKVTEGPEGGVAELVDLEQELCSLRRGLTQVEGLTPSTDPFGDSFIVPSTQKGLLPPPPSGSSTRGRNTPAAPRAPFSPTKALPFDLPPTTEFDVPHSLVDNMTQAEATVPQSSQASYDVFTELDPLGTGRSKPYVDKKLFFQELKNPPKKVLKDLVPTQTESEYATSMSSLTRHSGGTVTIAKPGSSIVFGGNFFAVDPFAETDPFDSADPFSESFKEDPFTSMQEFKGLGREETHRREDFNRGVGREDFNRGGGKEESGRSLGREELNRSVGREEFKRDELVENGNVFNGPLQVSLPPEPAPRSPRLHRQGTDSSTVRQRPQRPQGRLNVEPPSPPPPLPPKKCVDSGGRPPPRPPLDHEEEEAPPLPRPARKKEPPADRSIKPRLSSTVTNSSEEEYLTPAPPPLPAARRFDITLSQLLTCSMDDLANRLRVPATTLSSMTLPQLTEYLRSYLAADNERAHIHVEPIPQSKAKPLSKASNSLPVSSDKPVPSAPPLSSLQITSEPKPQFEDNFTPPLDSSEFVANFDDFDKKANPSYDRYAAFREIQEQELKAKSILDPLDEIIQDSDEKHMETDDMTQEQDRQEISRSPLKVLDELTIDFHMFNSVSPKFEGESKGGIDEKIEGIKSVMKVLQIGSTRSVSPLDNGNVEVKIEDASDRYAALREITITEPQDEFESLPPEMPKERKRSDEKSDGFDNSDFFDCIDNSSLSFTHVEDAFRKSPSVKDQDRKVEPKEVQIELAPVRDLQPPARLSTGSISDVVSGSSPDTKEKCVSVGVGVGAGTGARWAVLGAGGGSGASTDSRDSEPPLRRRHRHHSPPRTGVQSSSSSRDASPWEDEPVSRVTRAPAHRSHDRDNSRHNSSGSRECLDSGSGREKDRARREGPRERRPTRARDPRPPAAWDRDHYREREYRDSRSRERQKEYREKDRERHRIQRHSYDEDEECSEGCVSGRSSPRGRWTARRRDDYDRTYGSLGWRGHRKDPRPPGDHERRYGTTLAWAGGGRRPRREDRDRSDRERSDRERSERERSERERSDRERPDRERSDRERPERERSDRERSDREARRRPRREENRRRDYRFSNDFSPREQTSPFDNEFADVPAHKKRGPYSNLEGTRFAFEPEDVTASPLSISSARARDGDSTATRFRFDSDSISPRSMFEDDFSAPRTRTASIAEEDETVPPLKTRVVQHRDIKKSESINIFTREVDPFEGDAFFACTGSDRVARRDNWPGDFQGFDNA